MTLNLSVIPMCSLYSPICTAYTLTTGEHQKKPHTCESLRMFVIVLTEKSL